MALQEFPAKESDFAPLLSITQEIIRRTEQQPGFGYALTSTEVTTINNFYKTLKLNGIPQPLIWLRATLSVNPNVLVKTTNIINGTGTNWNINTAPTITNNKLGVFGTMTATTITSSALFSGVFQSVSCEANIPYTASVYLKGAVGGETVTFGTSGNGATVSPVTLTTSYVRYTMQGTFTGTGSQTFVVYNNATSSQTFDIDCPQLEIGSVATPYKPRSSSATVTPINLGTLNTVNGFAGTTANNGTMITRDSTVAGNVFKFTAANLQTITTGRAIPVNYSALSFFKYTGTEVETIFGGNNSTSPFLRVNASTKLESGGAATTTSVSTSTWNGGAVTYNGSNIKTYLAGVNEGTATASYTNGNMVFGANNATNYFNNLTNDMMIFDTVLTDANILLIYNALKGTYGL